jgi:hypothetical protein
MRVGFFTTLLAIFANAQDAPIASDGPGARATWTTGNKIAVGTVAATDSKGGRTQAQIRDGDDTPAQNWHLP